MDPDIFRLGIIATAAVIVVGWLALQRLRETFTSKHHDQGYVDDSDDLVNPTPEINTPPHVGRDELRNAETSHLLRLFVMHPTAQLAGGTRCRLVGAE